MPDLHGALLLQQAFTLLAGGYNAAHFLGLATRRGPRRPRGRRVAAGVLALTNLALAAGALFPGAVSRSFFVPWRPGLDLLVGLLPLGATGAMTVLVLRSRRQSRR